VIKIENLPRNATEEMVKKMLNKKIRNLKIDNFKLEIDAKNKLNHGIAWVSSSD
jgi:mevalonate pyrophosphate decarboxylase